MDRILPLMLLMLFSVSCVEKRSVGPANEPGISVADTSISSPKQDLSSFDSSYTLFSDTSYKLRFQVFNLDDFGQNSEPDYMNAVLTFTYKKDGKAALIFLDSLHCNSPRVEFRDLNNDRIKDVLAFYYSGGRANPTSHLYLVDTTSRRLKYVRGFEKLPNPELDTSNNIITSVALHGGFGGTYSFFRINSKGKLVSLGHGFEDDLNDSLKYDGAIRQILRTRR